MLVSKIDPGRKLLYGGDVSDPEDGFERVDFLFIFSTFRKMLVLERPGKLDMGLEKGIVLWWQNIGPRQRKFWAASTKILAKIFGPQARGLAARRSRRF